MRSDDEPALTFLLRPHAVELPASAPRRGAPRPTHLRADDYHERFDDHTLFYDVFRSGDSVVTVGPPLLDLAAESRRWVFSFDDRPAPYPRTFEMDRTQRCVFRADPEATTFSVTAGADSVRVPIGTDLASVFAGTKALMTLQLDNDLEWIGDWVRWHVRAQGTDAVVVYDNGSTRYGLEDVLSTISEVEGVRVAGVVDWAYRYGPQGGPGIPWDSDFAQYGAIEHARRRMFPRAAGVLSVDLDELVHSPEGTSVYDEAVASAQGFALFDGRWTYADPAVPPARPRHADCRFVRVADARTDTKWCAVPSRLPRGAQLAVHEAYGLVAPPLSASTYWHMRPISTHWKIDRTGRDQDPDEFALEPRAAELLDAVLVHSSTIVAPPRRRRGRAPLAERLRVAAESVRGLPSAAERWARRTARRIRHRRQSRRG